MVYGESNPWRNLPRGVVESPSLEDFKVLLGRVLGNLIQAPFSHQKLGPGELLGSLTTWAILWLCDSAPAAPRKCLTPRTFLAGCSRPSAAAA